MTKSKSDFIEPFKDYIKVKLDSEIRAEEGDVEGKQEKGIWTGFYKNKQGELVYIKKSTKHAADNLSEVVTADLLGKVIGDHAVPYEFVSSRLPEDQDAISDPNNETGDADYIVSPCRDEFTTLKAVAYQKFPTKWVGAVGADLHTDANKDKLYNSLTAKQKAQLALVLAGCALVLERDSQRGNIIFYKHPQDKKVYTNKEEQQENMEIGKFDNGWGLAGICLPDQARVDIFSRRLYMLSSEGEGTHTRRLIPTNHFNDFPRIIRSQYFIDALDHVVQNAKDNLTITDVHKTIEKIRNHFSDDAADLLAVENSVQNELIKSKLIELADHLGILTALKYSKTKPSAEKKFRSLSVDEMETFIITKLTRRLAARAESLNSLKVLLNLDLHYQPMVEHQESKESSEHNAQYDPESDLLTLQEHFLKIIAKINRRSEKKGLDKESAQKAICFEELEKHLPVFVSADDKNLKVFIQQVIKKYRQTTHPQPNEALLDFYDKLLKDKAHSLMFSSKANVISSTKVTSQLNQIKSNKPIKLSAATRGSHKQDSLHAFNKARSPDEKSQASSEFSPDRSTKRGVIPCSATAKNKSLHSLEFIAAAVVEASQSEQSLKQRVSYKKLDIAKDESYIVLQVDRKDSILLKTRDNKIHLEAAPVLDQNPEDKKSSHLQIKLFALTLIKTEDLSPVITEGSAEQVTALIIELKKHNKEINPTIHSRIQFDADQKQRLDTLLLNTHSIKKEL